MQFIDLKTQQAQIKSRIDARIQDVLAHGQYVLGPEVVEVEQVLAERTGVAHCITTASGTDSLLMALMALGIGAGDEVITVPYTWISTAEVVALAGATPVFVDICEQTWNMDPALVEAAITPQTKAIMPVGIYGQPADMIAINAVAEKHGIPVIEDAAQCYGAHHHGAPSGALSTIGSTSFFPSKPLGCYGDGGALFTNDDRLAETLRQIRVHGQSEKHHHPILGLNGRFDTIQAAILLEKIAIFDDEIQRRNQVAAAYTAALDASSLQVQAPRVAEGNTSVWAQYTILAEDPATLQARLQQQGIPSVSYYAVPLHLQPVFAPLGHQRGDFPVTERVASQCLSLPMNPYLTEAEIAQVTSALSC